MLGARGPFEGVIADPLQGRSAKPRTAGLTMVIDKGLGQRQIRDLLEVAAGYIDFIKLGFGTAALYDADLLRARIDLIRSHGVEPYPGGTLLEVAWLQGRLQEYLSACERLGFRLVEVSDGTVSLEAGERREIVHAARQRGFTVISEVGKKDGETPLDPVATLAQIRDDLEAGAALVIVEGRESGKGVGIYDPAGRIRQDDLEVLISGLADPTVLIWEAPLKEQQQALIARLGPDVNLGNIAPADVIALEALRRGLRGDTLKLVIEEAIVRGGAS